MKKTLLLITTLIPIAASSLFAQDTSIQNLFQQANKAYEDSQFDNAVAGYEFLVSSEGISNPDLFYNLGNSYYRKNRIGKAILWYERALKLSPQNDDISFNLRFVRSLLKEQDESIVYSIINFFTLNGLLLFTSFAYFLLMAGIIASLFFKQGFIRRANISLGIIFLVAAIWCYAKYIISVKTVSAIVTSTPAEVRSGPGEDYAVGFTLPEGKKVNILSRENNWIAISVKQTEPVKAVLKGWILQYIIEKI